MALFYKDFVTGKRRWTYGKPVGIRRDGPLGVLGLVVQNPKSELFIPEYCLTGASRAYFNTYKAQAEKGDM